jgi:hypothetical protein
MKNYDTHNISGGNNGGSNGSEDTPVYLFEIIDTDGSVRHIRGTCQADAYAKLRAQNGWAGEARHWRDRD